MKKYLANKELLKKIMSFSIPFLLSYFLQTLYGLSDMYVIGQFNGVESITAVSIGSQIMKIITVIFVGLSSGCLVNIGHLLGAGNKKKLNKIIGSSVTFFMIFSIVFSLIVLLFINQIVFSVSTPKEALFETKTYLRVCFIAIPFISMYNLISSIFRGMGDSKSPMYFIAIACIFNIGLDYLFIGAFELGAMGAALATSLAQAFSVIISIIIIKKRKMIKDIKKEHFKPSKNILKNILKIGFPISLQDALIQISFLILTVIANKRGLIDSAAVGIVEKIIGIIFLIPSTMLSTVTSLAAISIGAKKYKEAKQILFTCSSICLTFGLFSVFFMRIFSIDVISMFTSSKEVIVSSKQYLSSYIWDCVFAGIHFSFSGYFTALGKSHFAFIHNIISIIIARIPLAYIFSNAYPENLFPMGMASTIGSIISLIICILFYRWINKNFVKIINKI